MSQRIELVVENHGTFHVVVQALKTATGGTGPEQVDRSRVVAFINEWPLSLMGRIVVPSEQAQKFALAILAEIGYSEPVTATSTVNMP